MSKIKIEQGIPVPPLSRDYLRGSKYPLADMKAGQSFAVPGGQKAASSIRSVISRRKAVGSLARDVKFTMRFRVEDGVDVVRVWRVS